MTYGIRHVNGYSDMTSIQFRDWKIGWLKLLTPFSTVFVYGCLISKAHKRGYLPLQWPQPPTFNQTSTADPHLQDADEEVVEHTPMSDAGFPFPATGNTSTCINHPLNWPQPPTFNQTSAANPHLQDADEKVVEHTPMSDAGFPSTATGNTSNPPRFTAPPAEVLLATALLCSILSQSRSSEEARVRVQRIHDNDRIVEDDSLSTTPSPNPFDGPIIERPHPPRPNVINGSPFYTIRSAPDARERRRGKEVKVPLPSLSSSSGRRLVPSTPHERVGMEAEVPTASGNGRGMNALDESSTTESEASSSAAGTVVGQQSPSLRQIYSEWMPLIAHGAEGQPRLRLQVLEKASSVACSNPEEEDLDRRYQLGGQRIEDDGAMSESGFSPDRNNEADREYVMNWMEDAQAQSRSPPSQSLSRPPSMIESIPESPDPRHATQLLAPPSSQQSNVDCRDQRHPKPPSTSASTTASMNEGRDQRPSAQEFRRRIFDEAMKWNIVHAKHLPRQIRFAGNFDSVSESDTFEKVRSDHEMRREWIRREYFVLNRKMIDPVPMRYFGTPKWYALDLLRCFTNMNGHRRGRGEATWPEGYVPRYLEEAKVWDKTKDFSVASESVMNDDETESMRSEMTGSNR
ncbi:MAG: hypothetical protein Q9205_004633 [Flavoplaca limonia]